MRAFPRIPPSTPPELATHLRDLSSCVQLELQRRTPDNASRNSIILISPDGSSWEVTVDDAGDLNTVKVQG